MRRLSMFFIAAIAAVILTACATDDSVTTTSEQNTAVVAKTTSSTAVKTTSTVADTVREKCLKKAPLPDDFAIQQPAADVPPNLAKFVGPWGGGDWSGLEMCTALIVQSVDSVGNVKAIYSNGPYGGYINPEYRTITGTVKDGIFKSYVGELEVRYWFDVNEPNVLKGRFYGRNGYYDTELTLFKKEDIPS